MTATPEPPTSEREEYLAHLVNALTDALTAYETGSGPTDRQRDSIALLRRKVGPT